MSSSPSPSSIATLLRHRIEHIVDQLPAECDVLPEHRQPKKPRFLNAVIVMADRTKCGDDLLKATLQKQLDPYPEKESPRVEEAPQKSEIEEKEHSNQVGQRIEHYENGLHLSNGHNGGNKQQPIIVVDAIAEAVRVLREADKMLERKLQQNGWSLEIAPQPAAAAIVVPKSPAKAAVATTNGSTTFPRSQKQQTVGFTSSTATTTTTSATAAGSSSSSRRPSLFASSINFPSELRKYKTATTTTVDA